MIENIRKYNILIIIGLVVVAAALVIGLNTANMGGPGGAPYIKVGTRTYTDTEYRQLGLNGRELVNSLAQSGDFQRMYQFLFSLAPDSMFSANSEDSTEQFFINRMLVQQAKKEFGIHPSEEQIDKYTRSLAAFRGADQEFDSDIYARVVDKGLGRMGMSERNLRELISDIIATGQLRAVISSGLLTHPDIAAKRNALDSQKISGSVARLELDAYTKSIEPTEEDLKTYWELIQDAYTTEEQRRFTYILVDADLPKEEAPANKDKELSLTEAAMTDEQKAETAKKKAEEEAAKKAEIAEQRRIKQRELDAKVDDFTYALEEQNGKGFEELVIKNGWELKTTKLFSQNTAPKELELDLRSSGRGGDAISELFRMIVTDDPISKISQPLAVGESAWLVARLEETVASRVKTFEEAKIEVREQYIEEKAADALEKAMKEASTNISKALQEGKAFTDAAVESGLTLVEPFADTSASSRPAKRVFPDNLFQVARSIDPGKTSEVIIQDKHAYLIHVSSRQVDESVNNTDLIENQVKIAANQNSMAAFNDWLNQRTEKAAIERLYQ